MTRFHHLVETAADRGLDMHMQNIDDGRISVTVFLTDDPSEVCGLSCLLTGADGLDDAATALVPALRATLDGEPVDVEPRDEPVEGSLVAAECSKCTSPIVYAGSAGDAVALCPPCATRQRQVDRLSLSLSLAMVQGRLDEIAGDAPNETATELVPVLIELARLDAVLTEDLTV